MSNGSSQPVPLDFSVAPFPEGFQGDLDEHAQQLVQLLKASMQGNFLTGLVLPPGSTLPTTDQGPIAMGGTWYFWDPVTGQYLPQSMAVKAAKNYAKNCIYQVQQYPLAGAVPSGISNVCDMAQVRSSLASVFATSQVTGPPADANGDYRSSALQYTVGPTLVPTPGSTDLYVHEHLIEGSDLAMVQGEILTLSLDVWFNQAGTYSVYLTSSGRDVSYVANFTIATPSTWARIKLQGIPALPTSMGTWHFAEGQTGLYVGVAMCVGSQWQATTGLLNSWQHAFFAGSPANSNLCTVVNNQLRVTGIKLEASPTATYLTIPSFETDLHDAIRYYFSSFNYQSVTAGVATYLCAPANGQYLVGELFPRRMCRVPLVTPYGYTSHASGNITDVSLGVDIPVASVAAVNKGLSDNKSTLTLATTGTLGSVQTGTIASLAITGTTTNNSNSITALSSVTGIAIGAEISGAGIPAGATVIQIPTNASILISAVCTGNNTGTALTLGTVNVTALSTTTGLAVGNPVTGTGIPANTTIATIVSSSAVNLSQPATPGTGISLSFSTPNVTALGSSTGLAVGMTVTGTGIPAGTTIAALVSGTAVTLSQPATPGTGVALTFYLVNKGDTLAAFIIADARLS